MTASSTLSRSREAIYRLAGSRIDAASFRHEAVAQLRRAVGFDSWCWSSIDPISALPVGGLADNPALAVPGSQRTLFELEFGAEDVNHYHDLSRERQPVGRLVASTGGMPERSPRWSALLEPRGVGDELRVVFVLGGECWGDLVLYRSQGGPAFTAAEAAFVASVVRIWAERHRAEVFESFGSAGSEHTEARTGILICDAAGGVLATTADADTVLAALPHRVGDLPLCITAILAWLAVHPQSLSTPQVPVRDSAGRWVLVQAHRLEGAVPSGTLTVSLADAQPYQLVSLAMAAAGLTRRERDVTNLVLAGLQTAEIAARLYVTPYTVQDHLKSVFAKFAVCERRQLVALLLHDPAS